MCEHGSPTSRGELKDHLFRLNPNCVSDSGTCMVLVPPPQAALFLRTEVKRGFEARAKSSSQRLRTRAKLHLEFTPLPLRAPRHCVNPPRGESRFRVLDGLLDWSEQMTKRLSHSRFDVFLKSRGFLCGIPYACTPLLTGISDCSPSISSSSPAISCGVR